MRALPITPVLLLLGCTADSDSKLDTAGPQDSGLPSLAQLETAFTVDASGGGEQRLDSVSVQGNLASLVLSGVPHTGFAYQHHDWQSTGYVLFDLLTVADDGSNLAVTYLYGQDGQLPYVYTESFEHPMDWEVSSGTVSWEQTPTTIQPQVPALEARPNPTDLGIDMDGEELWLEGSSGGVVVDGVSFELLPFASVDCTDCPGGPWLELHSLLVPGDGAALSRGAAVDSNAAGHSGVPGDGAALSRGAAVGSNAAGRGGGTSASACFGIVYLFPEDPSYAQLSYGICLPGLETPSGEYELSWSGSLAASRGPGRLGPPAGRPPRAR
jgi:hypothetical protein